MQKNACARARAIYMRVRVKGSDTMPDKCPDNCPLEPRVNALEEANKNYDRLNEKTDGRLSNLETENAVQNAHYSAVNSKLDELTTMVRELTAKAGKRWDSLVDKAIWAVAAAVIAYLLARAGL